MQHDLRDLEEKLEHLFTLHKVQTQEEFTSRWKSYQEKELLNHRGQEFLLQAEAIAGSNERLMQLLPLCKQEDQITWERRITEIKLLRAELQQSKDRFNQALGQAQERIRLLEQDESVSKLTLQQSEVQSRLHALTEEWAVYTLSAALLVKAREKYEKERQPAVLKHASKLMQKITNERYLEVRSKLGQEQIELITSEYRTTRIDTLSRGTAEQLYLAMRFSLIKELQERNIVLPIILDDVFVNFDRERVQFILPLLQEMSVTHQILFFTCHTELAELLESRLSGTSRIQLPKRKSAVKDHLASTNSR